jgi:peptidoglycan/LPS O-acetylase OafA/YrhL
MASQKIDSLDALRGILASVVLLGHSMDVFVRQVDALAPFAEAANKAAHASVVCFFCLSGFVIAMSIDVNRRRGFSPGEFAAARAFRIAPPLLAVVALTWLLQLLLEAAGASRLASADAERAVFATAPAEQLLALLTLGARGDLTGANLNGPLWSLAYEIHLYVIAGLLATVAFYRSTAWRIGAAVLLCGYLQAIGLWPLWSAGFNSRTATMLAFGLGAAAYACRGASPGAVAAVAGAFAAGAAGCYAFAWHGQDTASAGAMTASLLLFETMAAGVFSALLIPLGRSGTLGGLRWLGAFSYTLYIGHFPLLLAVQFALHGLAAAALSPAVAPVTWLATTAGVFVACALAGRMLEQPAAQRRWLQRVTRRRTPMAA